METKKPTPNQTRPPAISFVPLSDGLGFHPFSDGLPYAPVTKASPPSGRPSSKDLPLAAALNPDSNRPLNLSTPLTGTGAVAAGRPIPVPPSKAPTIAPPRVSVPVGAPASRAAPPSAPMTVAGIPVTASTGRGVAVTRGDGKIAVGTTLSESSEIEAALAERPGIGYLFKRAFAFLIDTAVNTTLCFLALGGVMVRLDLSWDAFSNPSLLLLGILFLVMFNWSIVTAQEVILGTTMGKRMFGLVLRGDTSALFLRAFFFLPSVIFCGLGVIWALFDRRRRCWHDHAVDVQPLELARL